MMSIIGANCVLASNNQRDTSALKALVVLFEQILLVALKAYGHVSWPYMLGQDPLDALLARSQPLMSGGCFKYRRNVTWGGGGLP